MPEVLTHTALKRPARPAFDGAVGGGHRLFAPCHIFPSADGAFFLAVSTDLQFSELSALAGQPQWAQDPRFVSHHARYQHDAELTQLLRRYTVEHRTEEWVAALQYVGVPCAALVPSPAGAGR